MLVFAIRTMSAKKSSKKQAVRHLRHGKWIAVGVGILLLIPLAVLIWNTVDDDNSQQAEEDAVQQEIADIEHIVSTAEEDPDYYNRTIGEIEASMDEDTQPKSAKEREAKLQKTLELAALYYRNGQYDEAIESYELAKTLVPKNDKNYDDVIASYDLLIHGVEHARDGGE